VGSEERSNLKGVFGPSAGVHGLGPAGGKKKRTPGLIFGPEPPSPAPHASGSRIGPHPAAAGTPGATTQRRVIIIIISYCETD
jgi:hypothetical protein